MINVQLLEQKVGAEVLDAPQVYHFHECHTHTAG